MMKIKSKENFYERMNYLSSYGNPLPINEDDGLENSNLIKHVKASNGITLGIIKENHQYHIKTTKSQNENLDVTDFAYIGGLANKMKHCHPSLGEADKQLNMHLLNINESMGYKDPEIDKKLQVLNEQNDGVGLDIDKEGMSFVSDRIVKQRKINEDIMLKRNLAKMRGDKIDENFGSVDVMGVGGVAESEATEEIDNAQNNADKNTAKGKVSEDFATPEIMGVGGVAESDVNEEIDDAQNNADKKGGEDAAQGEADKNTGKDSISTSVKEVDMTGSNPYNKGKSIIDEEENVSEEELAEIAESVSALAEAAKSVTEAYDEKNKNTTGQASITTDSSEGNMDSNNITDKKSNVAMKDKPEDKLASSEKANHNSINDTGKSLAHKDKPEDKLASSEKADKDGINTTQSGNAIGVDSPTADSSDQMFKERLKKNEGVEKKSNDTLTEAFDEKNKNTAGQAKITKDSPSGKMNINAISDGDTNIGKDGSMPAASSYNADKDTITNQTKTVAHKDKPEDKLASSEKADKDGINTTQKGNAITNTETVGGKANALENDGHVGAGLVKEDEQVSEGKVDEGPMDDPDADLDAAADKVKNLDIAAAAEEPAEDPLPDEAPVPDAGGEVPAEEPLGDEMDGEEGGLGMDDADKSEIDKFIGKLTQLVSKTELEPKDTLGDLKGIVTAYKSNLDQVDPEQKKDLADTIVRGTGVDGGGEEPVGDEMGGEVPAEEPLGDETGVENLNAASDPEIDGEVDLETGEDDMPPVGGEEEPMDVEMGGEEEGEEGEEEGEEEEGVPTGDGSGFLEFIKGRGYGEDDNISVGEMVYLVNSWANDYGDGMAGDGDMGTVASYVGSKDSPVAQGMKDSGHEDFMGELEPHFNQEEGQEMKFGTHEPMVEPEDNIHNIDSKTFDTAPEGFLDDTGLSGEELDYMDDGEVPGNGMEGGMDTGMSAEEPAPFEGPPEGGGKTKTVSLDLQNDKVDISISESEKKIRRLARQLIEQRLNPKSKSINESNETKTVKFFNKLIDEAIKDNRTKIKENLNIIST